MFAPSRCIKVSIRRCTRSYAQLAVNQHRQSLPSIPISIKLSAQELAVNRLTWKNLQIVIRAIHRDGLVVIEDVIDHPTLDALNREMMEDCVILQSRGENSPYNYNKGFVRRPSLSASTYN